MGRAGDMGREVDMVRSGYIGRAGDMGRAGGMGSAADMGRAVNMGRSGDIRRAGDMGRSGEDIKWREWAVPHWKGNTRSGSPILYATIRLICRKQGGEQHVMIV